MSENVEFVMDKQERKKKKNQTLKRRRIFNRRHRATKINEAVFVVISLIKNVIFFRVE